MCSLAKHRFVVGQDTYERAKQWVRELQLQGNPNLVIALAGNKVDLADKFRAVETNVPTCRGFLYVPVLTTHSGCSRVCQ
jgi:hypothetical protein